MDNRILCNRRAFLIQTTALSTVLTTAAASPQISAIDTHTHFYDPTRAQGVPWPRPDETLLYKPYLPAHFRSVTAPLRVVGTVVIEASPWVEDNQWVLDLAKDNPAIVGFIGNLKLGETAFAENLKRFVKNPLFRGLRIGEQSIAQGINQKNFTDDLRRLNDQGLTIDVIGGVGLLPLVLRIARLAPKLKVVIDHLPFNAWDSDVAAMKVALREVAALPNVYAKISNVVRRVEGRIIEDPKFYQAHLDALYELFGASRVIFGSNWPVSERVAPYTIVHKIVAEYFVNKGKGHSEKFFWKNSQASYRWLPRGAAKNIA